MATPEIITRLRDATGAAHARLEASLDILTQVADRAERVRLVSRFLALHLQTEAKLAPWLPQMAGLEAGLEAGSRMRAGLIRADLALLGGREQAASPGPAGPGIGSLGRALGRMYVLEGSTLGGRTIHRALAKAGQDARGLGFLDPYGERTGERWRSFVAALDQLHRDGRADGDEIVTGGVEGFEHAARVLGGADALERTA